MTNSSKLRTFFLKFQRGFKLREKLANSSNGQEIPTTLHVLPSTPQIKGLHTFIRNRHTQRDEFVFYSNRLIRLVLEFTLSLLPFEDKTVVLPQGISYKGKSSSLNKVCGVSILRAGEAMEQAVYDVFKDIRIGKILIQTNFTSGEPEVCIGYFCFSFSFSKKSEGHFLNKSIVVLSPITEGHQGL